MIKKKKIWISISLVLLIWLGWVPLAGKALSRFYSEVEDLKNYIKVNHNFPSDERAFLNYAGYIPASIKINYDLDINSIKNINKKLFDDKKNRVWLVKSRSVILGPIGLLLGAPISYEVYECYKKSENSKI